MMTTIIYTHCLYIDTCVYLYIYTYSQDIHIAQKKIKNSSKPFHLNNMTVNNFFLIVSLF